MSYNFLALSIGIFFLILAIFSSLSTIAETNARTCPKTVEALYSRSPASGSAGIGMPRAKNLKIK